MKYQFRSFAHWVVILYSLKRKSLYLRGLSQVIRSTLHDILCLYLVYFLKVWLIGPLLCVAFPHLPNQLIKLFPILI